MTDILFEDAFELLDAVRTYDLNRGEKIISYSSVYGDTLGFAVADTTEAATRFLIKKSDLRRSCLARSSSEAQVVLERMTFFIDRYQLGKDIRSGVFSLEERPAPDIGVLPQLDGVEEDLSVLEPDSPPRPVLPVLSESDSSDFMGLYFDL